MITNSFKSKKMLTDLIKDLNRNLKFFKYLALKKTYCFSVFMEKILDSKFGSLVTALLCTAFMTRKYFLIFLLSLYEFNRYSLSSTKGGCLYVSKARKYDSV